MTMKLWQTAENYAGENLSDYYVLISWQPDQWDSLAQSNYEFITDEFDARKLPYREGNFGSWAGSFTAILIHKDDAESVELGNEMTEQMEHYPVLDEDRYSELQWEQAEDIWEYGDKAEFCRKAGIKKTERKSCPPAVFDWLSDNGWLN